MIYKKNLNVHACNYVFKLVTIRIKARVSISYLGKKEKYQLILTTFLTYIRTNL